MSNLAPHITRQRLLIEGYYNSDIDKDFIRTFLLEVANDLELRAYGDPTIYSPEGMGKGENQDFDAFMPLIDSGISVYVWTQEKFMSVIFYTCKNFSEERAIEFTKKHFKLLEEVEFKSF